jgi:hypothetical protein
MRALMVKHPWSGLISWGLKPYEIRTWRTKMRGQLLICSSASPSRNVDASRIEIEGPPALGVTMCIVDLVDCRPFEASDADGAWCSPSTCLRGDAQDGLHEWDGRGKERCLRCQLPREYVWELRSVRTVERVPVKGRLNFFDFEGALVRPGVAPLPHIRRR